MIFRETKLAGAYRIELERHEDERGFFARTFCEREFAARGLRTRYPQCNVSRSPRRGTLRGLHLQAEPHGEVKIVRCLTGAIFDVAVDLRPASPTYRQWVGLELTAEQGTAFYIPAGCAHGLITLVPDVNVFYQMGDVQVPEASRGFRWDDPAFAIQWPLEPVVISARDRAYADFDATHVDA